MCTPLISPQTPPPPPLCISIDLMEVRAASRSFVILSAAVSSLLWLHDWPVNACWVENYFSCQNTRAQTLQLTLCYTLSVTLWCFPVAQWKVSLFSPVCCVRCIKRTWLTSPNESRRIASEKTEDELAQGCRNGCLVLVYANSFMNHTQTTIMSLQFCLKWI